MAAARRRLPALLGVAFLLATLGLDRATGVQLATVYGVGAVIAAVGTRPRETAAVAALGIAAAFVSGVWSDNLGSSQWWVRLVACAVAGGAAVTVATLLARQKERLRSATHLTEAVLGAVALELTGARSTQAVGDAFVNQVAGRLGAASAMVFVLDPDDVLRSVTWMGRGGPQADQYAEIPLTAPLPGAVAVRSGQARHYPDREAIVADFPDLAGYYREDRSLHLIPLHQGATSTGLLAMTFPARSAAARTPAVMDAVGAALATALVRAAEIEAADAAGERTRLLSEASLRLSMTLDVEETLASVCAVLVPRLADWCAVHLLVDGRLETVALLHRDPATTEWALGLRDRFPANMESPTGAPAVVRTGRSVVYPVIPAELIDAAATSEEHRELLHRLGMVSAVIAPLHGRDGVLGAISLAHAESGRHYAEADREFLDDLASRIALAVDTATSFHRQSERLSGIARVAEAAQRAILAPVPAAVGHLGMAARYVSAVQEAQIGGDLYEVVPTDDRVRLLVGDVRGKGLQAVRTATVALGAFRSAATQPVDLPTLAVRMDEQLRHHLRDDEEFVSACLVDIATDGRLTVVSCGHPPPVLLGDGTAAVLPVDASPPLGLVDDAPQPYKTDLVPGDRVLLHTDGLTEARDADGQFPHLETLLARCAAGSLDETLDAVLAALRAHTGGQLDDDLALLGAEHRG